MALIPDLTKPEISTEISDTVVQTWWEATPALPIGADTAELFAKILQAAFVAQSKKNAAGTPAPGEALNAYPAPLTGTVQTDTTTGLQFFNAAYSVQIAAVVDLNVTAPQRV
ncbi:MAG TPA: hypothetical protein VE956_13630 [Nodularia sp. (in: cyanobacteria)]|nr:hypothetical protein [Nodularia sp. (in: cyanobacteria)]